MDIQKFEEKRNDLMYTLDSITSQVDIRQAIDMFWELLNMSDYKEAFFEQNIGIIEKIAKRAIRYKIGNCEIHENENGIATYGLLSFDSAIHANIKFARYDNGDIKYILIDKNSDGKPEYIYEFDEEQNVTLVEIDENSDGNKDIIRRIGKNNDYYFYMDCDSDGTPESVFYGKTDSIRLKK